MSPHSIFLCYFIDLVKLDCKIYILCCLTVFILRHIGSLELQLQVKTFNNVSVIFCHVYNILKNIIELNVTCFFYNVHSVSHWLSLDLSVKKVRA
jgi:hypothetical protein